MSAAVDIADPIMLSQTAAGADPGCLPDVTESDALFAALFEQFEQPIYQYIHRLLGDEESARDFTQSTFLKAYRKLPETVAKGNFQPQAWLYRIAGNLCLDELRHRQVLKWQSLDAAAESAGGGFLAPVARDDPERDALSAETKREVEHVLAHLPPRYRTALVMREYYRLDYDQIARAMGTSRIAVKTLLLRAREAFRLHYATIHPTLAAQARGPRVLPRALGRTAVA